MCIHRLNWVMGAYLAGGVHQQHLAALTPQEGLSVHHDLVDQVGHVALLLEDHSGKVQQQLKHTQRCYYRHTPGKVKLLRCIKASSYIPENRLNFRMNISMKLANQYMAIFITFSPTSSHFHPLQAENCGSNSGLVVDKDDNLKSGLKESSSVHTV